MPTPASASARISSRLATFAAMRGWGVAQRLFDGVARLLEALPQPLALGREPHVATHPLEEAEAERALERLHLLRDGRDGDPLPGGGFTEGAGGGCRQEGPQQLP